MTNTYDFILTGAGASGLLTAVRMARHPYFAGKRILLIDKERKTANDRTWCWWEIGEGMLDEVIHHQWPSILIKDDREPIRLDITPYQYKMLRAEDFYRWAFSQIDDAAQFTFVAADIERIEENENAAVVHTSAGRFVGGLVINSALPTQHHDRPKKYPVLQQHFIGWYVKAQEPVFDAQRATFMDFSIPQRGNTRFMYVLPTSEREALLEYTLFSADHLPASEYEQGIEEYLDGLGITDYEIIEKEQGSIPMTAYPMSIHDTPRVHHIGTAGGWTKASTGFTFKNSIRKSEELVNSLASGRPIGELKEWDRFNWYDAVLLDVLSKRNGIGHRLFGGMFRDGRPHRILRFLDEESSFLEELQIMGTMPVGLFTRTAIARLFK